MLGNWKRPRGLRATAMGLLPLLASGNTHKTPGPYRKNIQAGLDWLLNHQTLNGDLASGANNRCIRTVWRLSRSAKPTD